MGFKRRLPQTLFFRALLILAAPVVLIQALAAVAIVQRHYTAVSQQMADTVAQELNYVVGLVERAPDVEAARAALAEAAAPLGLGLWLEAERVMPGETLRLFYDLAGGAIAETLKREVRAPLTLDLASYDKIVEARVQTGKGVLRVSIERRRLATSNPHQIFVWVGAASLLFVTIAALFLRNQVRPIRELAAAAEAFGKGRAIPFRPAGAEEVRRAGAAFLDMRARIERQIESRTRMLSGVSHDLRTPLTRMKLALELVEDGPEAVELRRDVEEMEHMIEAFLAFARDEAGEEPQPADPFALAREAAARARGAVGLTVEPEDGAATVTFRPGAIRRALQNLIDNALDHARAVELAVRLGPRHVDFEVEDDGPGIPEDQREAALKPFVRLDPARNQDRGGGVGLGLAIAADVARAHGGALTLGRSARLGGLSARLRLPR